MEMNDILNGLNSCDDTSSESTSTSDCCCFSGSTNNANTGFPPVIGGFGFY